MPIASYTALALAECRRRGWDADKAEHWFHPEGAEFGRRKDLFGFCDIVAISDWEVIAIQATSRANMSSRRHKLLSIGAALRWAKISSVLLWGYDQPGGKGSKYRLKEQRLVYEHHRATWQVLEWCKREREYVAI